MLQTVDREEDLENVQRKVQFWKPVGKILFPFPVAINMKKIILI